MALKILELRAKRRAKQMQLDGLREKQAELDRREAQAAAALEEAADDAALETVQAEIDAIAQEAETAGLPEAADTLEGELAEIDREIEEIETRTQQAAQNPSAGDPGTHQKERGIIMHRYQVRELLKTGAYYEREEVRAFYSQIRSLRAAKGAELTIPQIVVSRIMDIVGDYTTLYPLVDKITASGTVRILIDTDTTPASWIEQKGTLPTGDVGTITDVSFDGYKVGKVTFVDNCLLSDSIINLDAYVTEKLARAIGLALDKAILLGEGSSQMQPDGIIPKLPEGHTVTITDPKSFADVVKPLGLIDTGSDQHGVITAVVNRKTYYNRLLEFSVATTAAGEVVAKLPNLTTPNILGLPVVFNGNLPEDQILYGDYDKYTLVERESITIDDSPHVKFSEDQTAFRGKGRFDGKPTKPGAFVLAKLTYTESAKA